MKKTMYKENKEETAYEYTWPKLLTNVVWTFVFLFLLVKIVQVFNS